METYTLEDLLASVGESKEEFYLIVDDKGRYAFVTDVCVEGGNIIITFED